MSWIEGARLRRFFRRRLAPAAERLRARGVRFFPIGPDEDGSWYQPAPSGPELVALEVEDCERALRELWQEQDLPELVELAGPLVALSRRLEAPEDESGEVSPFVYVMY